MCKASSLFPARASSGPPQRWARVHCTLCTPCCYATDYTAITRGVLNVQDRTFKLVVVFHRCLFTVSHCPARDISVLLSEVRTLSPIQHVWPPPSYCHCWSVKAGFRCLLKAFFVRDSGSPRQGRQFTPPPKIWS